MAHSSKSQQAIGCEETRRNVSADFLSRNHHLGFVAKMEGIEWSDDHFHLRHDVARLRSSIREGARVKASRGAE